MPAATPFAFFTGLPITRVWRGYRSVFFLELGKLHDSKKGEVTIGFDACPWHVLKAGKEVLTHLDEPTVLDTVLPTLTGLRVQAVQVFAQQQRAQVLLSGNTVIETAHEHAGNAWYVLARGHQVAVTEGCRVITRTFTR